MGELDHQAGRPVWPVYLTADLSSGKLVGLTDCPNQQPVSEQMGQQAGWPAWPVYLTADLSSGILR